MVLFEGCNFILMISYLAPILSTNNGGCAGDLSIEEGTFRQLVIRKIYSDGGRKIIMQPLDKKLSWDSGFGIIHPMKGNLVLFTLIP